MGKGITERLTELKPGLRITVVEAGRSIFDRDNRGTYHRRSLEYGEHPWHDDYIEDQQAKGMISMTMAHVEVESGEARRTGQNRFHRWGLSSPTRRFDRIVLAAAGLRDALKRGDWTRAAAEIETSKSYAKAVMARAGVPTAAFGTFTSADAAEAFIRERGAPIVVKASGLAAGKGAIVCETVDDALEAARGMLVDGTFGPAGRTVVVEEYMEGEELSVFGLTDGTHVVDMIPAQDYKRIGAGDTGPNTGGMGACAPVSISSDALRDRVRREILEPTLAAMRDDGRTYRGLLFTTPGVEQYLSGVILFDETIRQRTGDGVPFADYLAKKGIIPGIKVDAGAKNLPLSPGEKVTEGLDGLPKRLEEYFKLGARFAKWRAVITIGAGIPTHTCIYANAHALARYAAACQEVSIVPIIEPEVLLDGDHTIERPEELTEATLRACYAANAAYNVVPEYVILKASMVVSGKNCPKQASVEEVAERTVRVLKRTVPAAQPGVVFLSGGQSDEAATAHLNAMASMKGLPWPLTFSYSRALQNPALKTWKGQAGNIAAAQKAFFHRAHMNGLAAQGKWRPELEKQAA